MIMFDYHKIAIKLAKTRSDIEGFKLRSFEEFRRKWENKNIYLRFESTSKSGRDEWIPASLNRDTTYGDIWGVWAFYLKYVWPENAGSLTKMASLYIFQIKGSPNILDTGLYSEKDYGNDISKLREFYKDKANNFERSWLKRVESYKKEGLELSELSPSQKSPSERTFEAIYHIEGTTKSTNFILRKIGYDVVIDSAGVINNNVYAPSVATVVLNPTLIDVIDSFQK